MRTDVTSRASGFRDRRPYRCAGCSCTRDGDDWLLDGCAVHDPFLISHGEFLTYAKSTRWEHAARLSAAMTLAAVWRDSQYAAPPIGSIERTLLDQALVGSRIRIEDIFGSPLDGADFMRLAADILEVARG